MTEIRCTSCGQTYTVSDEARRKQQAYAAQKGKPWRPACSQECRAVLSVRRGRAAPAPIARYDRQGERLAKRLAGLGLAWRPWTTRPGEGEAEALVRIWPELAVVREEVRDDDLLVWAMTRARREVAVLVLSEVEA